MESKTYCVLPFIHINSSVTGKIRPCCNATKFFEDMVDNDTSLKEAFYSKQMDELRNSLLNGERPSICDVCWKNEDSNITSQREYNLSKFSEYVGTEPKLRFLDIKFDNKCNLQCRMCDPYSSDQIWKTFELFSREELPTHLQQINKTREEYESIDNSENRKQYVIESLPDLTFLKCTGGEPFLSKHFLEVLDAAVDTGHAEHITLSITTNGTKFQKKITEKFKHFKAIDINISVDGTHETYDYIRYPFKWSQWHDRVIDFLSDMEEMDHPDFKYRFSITVTSYNYLNLCEIQKEIDSINGMFPLLIKSMMSKYTKSIKGINNVFYNFDLRPVYSELHAKWLPLPILKLERDKAQELFNVKFSTHPLNSIINFVDMCRKNQDLEKNLEKLNELQYTSNAIDKIRKQSFEVLHPTLVQYIKNGTLQYE